MLEWAKTFYNMRAVVKLEKHIRSYCRAKEKKRTYNAIESESDVVSHSAKAALQETRFTLLQ